MAQLNSPVDYHEALAKIASGITQLITEPRGSSKPFPQQYWMEMYTLVFKICSNTEDPRPRELYTDVSALLERHCQGFRQMLERLQLQDLLPAYLRIFERFFTGMENVAGILNYLNRWWIKSQCALPNFDAHAAGVFSVELLPYVIWYDELYTPLREGIFAAMMDCVSQTRQEATFVRGRPLLAAHDGTFSQLRSAVDSYVKLEENLRKLPKPAGHGTDDGGRPGGRPRIHNPYAAFEDSFIRASVEHYTRKGQELAQNGDAVCTEFMLSVERLLQQEARSVEKWVPAPCLAKCTECCLIALVYPHRELLHGAIPELLKADRQEDLRRLYRLLKPVHGLPPLLQALQQHVEDTGVEFLRQLDVSSTKSIGKGSKGNTAVKDSRSYAQGLWRLHSRSQGVVSFCCEGDVQCAAAVGGALRTVVNSAPRSAEALARFVNSAIASDRKFAIRSQDPQTGGAASEDADQGSFHNRHDSGAESGKKALVQLKMAGDLIKYIDDKDIFMHFTSRLMAKRLIQGGSDSPSSLELEEALIRILRPTCGHDFASRLQRMCTDCKLVPDLAARFDEWREKYYAVQATTRTAKKSTYVNPMVLNDEYIEDDMDGDVDGNDADTPSSGVGDDVGGAELASEKLPPVDETVSFQLLCLTAGSWPVGPQTPATAAAAGGGRSAVAAPTAANQLLDDTAVLAAGFALPAPLERWRGAFETFYTESFSGRKVTWLHHLSKVELSFPCATAECPMRVIHLVGTPQQAAVLLLFNETDASEGAPPRPLALGTVCRRLGMTRAEGSGVVLSLVASKVLDPLEQVGSSPGDYDINSSLTLRAGLGLRSNTKPRPKIKLTSVESALQQLQHSAASTSRSGASGKLGRERAGNSRESEKQASGVSLSRIEDDDVADADESLFDGGSPSIGGRQRHRGSAGGEGSSLQEERKQVLQAAIVRVLKTRKTSTFSELMSAVVSQLQGRFVPTVPDVKLNIDRLIDKEYIARDPDQMDLFVYVA